MKIKELNNTVGLNVSAINKSKDSTNLEILRTDIESKDVILQKHQQSKSTPPKSDCKIIENNDISFAGLEKIQTFKINEQQNNENESNNLPNQAAINPENIDELVCEPSFCENDHNSSVEKEGQPVLKAKNSKEEEFDQDFFKDIGIRIIFLKHLK